MLIDLTDIIKNVSGKLTFSDCFDMPNVSFMGEEFDFSEPFKAEGTIINNSKSLELNMTVRGRALVHCARCGKPLTADIFFPVTETLVREGEEMPEDEDVILYSGKEIELDDVIVSNLLMNVPVKYLCRDDCKGLCQICGADLNETTCDCGKDTIDPRWEKLAEIMKGMTDTK